MPDQPPVAVPGPASVSPADTLRRIEELREKAARRGRVDRPDGDSAYATPGWSDVLFLLDERAALLAVGERDRAERDAAVREAGVWQRDRNVQVAALTEAGERDRRQIARLTEPLTEIAVEVKLANDLSLEGQLAALWGVVRRHSTIARAAVLADEEDAG